MRRSHRSARPSFPEVVNVPLSVTNHGAPIVATFTDSDPAIAPGDFSAATIIVSWGDGTANTPASTITAQGAAPGVTYFVQADPTYTAPGDYQVLIIIPATPAGSGTVAHLRGHHHGRAAHRRRGDVQPLPQGSRRERARPRGRRLQRRRPRCCPRRLLPARSTGATARSRRASSRWSRGTDTETDFQVSGDHIYTEEGSYSITVTVTTLGSNPVSTTSTATIGDAPLTAQDATFDAPEGVSMTQPVASFTDANPAAPLSDFTATIDWGDGTQSDGTITQPNGIGTPFLVTGTHTYNDDDGGNENEEMDGWPVTVTIMDIGGSVAIANSQANTFDPVLIDPGVAVQAAAGTPFQGNVATFSTTDLVATAGDFTAVINWGDSQSSMGTIVGTGPGDFRVVGDHHLRPLPGSFGVEFDEDQRPPGPSRCRTGRSGARSPAPPIAAQAARR